MLRTGYDDSTKYLLTWLNARHEALEHPAAYFHWISFVTRVSEILRGRLNRDVLWISARPVLSALLGNEKGKRAAIHWTKPPNNSFLWQTERNSIDKNSLSYNPMLDWHFTNTFWHFVSFSIFIRRKTLLFFYNTRQSGSIKRLHCESMLGNEIFWLFETR